MYLSGAGVYVQRSDAAVVQLLPGQQAGAIHVILSLQLQGPGQHTLILYPLDRPTILPACNCAAASHTLLLQL